MRRQKEKAEGECRPCEVAIVIAGERMWWEMQTDGCGNAVGEGGKRFHGASIPEKCSVSHFLPWIAC